MARKRTWWPTSTRAFVPTFPLRMWITTPSSSVFTTSPMSPSVMCTSVQRAKSCTSLPGIRPSVPCATVPMPKTAITARSSPSVPLASKVAACVAVWMRRYWNGCVPINQLSPTRKPYGNVRPLFAEGKDWHGMRRFRLRRLWRVNCETLMRAAGQNLKRLLKRRGWGCRPCPAEALHAPLLAALGFFTCPFLEPISTSMMMCS